MDCPNCGEFNSMLAERCACGHELRSNASTADYSVTHEAANGVADPEPPSTQVVGSRHRPQVLVEAKVPRPPEITGILASFVALSMCTCYWNVFLFALSIPVSVLLVVGFLRGHPLAWQWGMIVPSMNAAFFLMEAVIGFNDRAPFVSIVFMASVACAYLAIPVLLKRDVCRIFFGLKCPSCGNLHTRAAVLLYTKHRCPRCGTCWVHGRSPDVQAMPPTS